MTLTTNAAQSARTASCMDAIQTDRSIASTPPPTARSFSWWTWTARRSYAYAKPPSRDIQIAHAQEQPTSVIRHRHLGAVAPLGGGYSTALSARYDGWAGLYDEHGQHTIVLIEYD